MPRRQKPARLWERKDENTWIILHKGKHIRTGISLECGEEAQNALLEYLNSQTPDQQKQINPSDIKLGKVLDHYAEARGPKQAAPERTGYAIEALAAFWGDLTPLDVTLQNSLKYENMRKVSAGTIRRELGVLNTALNYAAKSLGLASTLRAELPTKPEPLDRWLTQDEVSSLREHVPPHVDRFIVLSLFTGRRKKAILDLRWERSPHNGWIDLDNKKIYFKGYIDAETSKRRGAITMPEPLYRLARDWKEDGNRSVIHYQDKPVKDVDTSFDRACSLCGFDDVVPHTLKHTAVTWAFQNGMTLEDAVDYFATSAETLLKTYKHHSPHYQDRAVAVMNDIGNNIIAGNVAEDEKANA